ncbi:MAG: hypothetical protein M3Y75_11025 [Actinomycetota bacterium]|nr:hypothetical protein [Actinomycetota bacterium]
MQEQGRPEAESNAAEDRRDERRVLVHVVEMYPGHLRLADLIRELADQGKDEFAERDRIERAVRELIAGGLLFRCEAMILPTRAALKFAEVVEDG